MKPLSNGQQVDRKLLGKYIFRLVLQILAVLSIAVFAMYVMVSVSSYFTGFVFFFQVYYGWEAVESAFLILGYIWWPFFLFCGLIIVLTVVYFTRTKEKYPKDERRLYLKYIGKAMVKPLLGLGILAVLFFAGAFFFSSTYAGARMLVKMGKEDKAPCTYTLRWFVELEDEYMVMKNGELIGFNGIFENGENIDFLDDFYYVLSYAGEKFERLDMTGADEYVFLDRDGVYEGALLVKGKYVIYGTCPEMLSGNREKCEYMIRIDE